MSAPNTFNLLALGHRNVGKTVFLAGSYAGSRPNFDLSRAWRLWFDCDNIIDQRHLEEMLQCVARTGRYPPPTVKVTQFTFRLQRRSVLGIQTLCHFSWCDVPGELCNIHNPSFQKILLNSHGCCLFIDAKALVRHGATYLETLESFVKKAEVISAEVQQRGCQYPLALILTKCDRLEPGPQSRLQLEQNLKPLLDRLDAVQANYRSFLSSIPITTGESITCLQPTHAAIPFLWLTAELRTLYRTQHPQALATGLQELLQGGHQQQSSDRTVAKPRAAFLWRPFTLLQVAGVSLLGGIIAFYCLSMFNQARLYPKRGKPQTTKVCSEFKVFSAPIHRCVVARPVFRLTKTTMIPLHW